MNKYSLLHVAVQYSDEKSADIFFGKVLGLDVVREFSIPSDFSYPVFGTRENARIKTYSDGTLTFEVFFLHD
jgi:hypothetical protein